MHAKQICFLLAILLVAVHTSPTVDKRYTLKPGMEPIHVPNGTHAYRRDEDISKDKVDLSKRVVIVEPNGTVVRPSPVRPHGPVPEKRYIIDGPNGTVIRPTPVGPGKIQPEKRSMDDTPEGSPIRSRAGPRGLTPFNRV